MIESETLEERKGDKYLTAFRMIPTDLRCPTDRRICRQIIAVKSVYHKFLNNPTRTPLPEETIMHLSFGRFKTEMCAQECM